MREVGAGGSAQAHRSRRRCPLTLDLFEWSAGQMSAQADALVELRHAAVDRCDELAAKLLGNPRSADRHEMRWGAHGKLALQLAGDKRGLWFDFSTGKGGDMIALIVDRQGGTVAQAIEWLRRELSLPAPERPAGSPRRRAMNDRRQNGSRRRGHCTVERAMAHFASTRLFRGARARGAG